MKFFCSSTIALLAAVLAAPSLAQQDPGDPRPAFIARLKAVADAGKLLDPSAVSAILGIDLHGDTSSIEAVCYQSTKKRSVKTSKLIAGPGSWYQPLPTGAGHLEIPAFMVNRASTTGDATLGYTIVDSSACPADSSQKNHIEARLSFGGLPSYACFAPADVQRLLPAAKAQSATEGIAYWTYEGKKENGTGTRLEFWFRPLVPCAISASIVQSEISG